MKAVDRRNRIVTEVNRRGHVTVVELSRLLGVSEVTIRADLGRLDTEGAILRGFGGAMAHPSRPEENPAKAGMSPSPFDALWPSTEYSTSMIEEKIRMARKAASLVQEGDIILLDGSNTSYYLCRELALRNPRIIAATNSLDILDVFRQAPNVQIIALGGEFHDRYNATFGTFTIAAIRGISASKVFLSPKSLDVVRGALLDSSMAHAVRRAMLEVARERYLMADHSKFSSKGILQLAEWSDITGIITDRTPPPEFQAVFANVPVNCMVAE